MSDEQARVLARGKNLAVTQLDGRAFPGVHIQGDTFAELQRQLTESVGRLRDTVDMDVVLADLEHVANEIAEVLRFYDAALEQHGIKRPYFR